MFEKVSDPAADRPAVLHSILRELAAHVAAERAEVLPVAKSHDIGGDGFADELVADYERIEELMVLIERRKFNSPDVPGLVADLKGVVEAHAGRGRDVLVPGLRRSLRPEELDDLGEKVSHADSMVISHPHPHLLSLGGISSRLTRLLARFDLLRDRTVTSQPPPDQGDPSMGGAS